MFRDGTLFDGYRHIGRGDVLVGRRADRRGRPRGSRLAPTRSSTSQGGLLSPGFVDAHVHPIQGGLERLRCDLSEQSTREEYLATIRQYADANPDVEWILGGGWAMPAFPGGNPTAADLDTVVPDRPVFLPNRDHHGAWVNSRALEIAGIDAHTADPPDGRIERDADGRPSGTLHEGATSLVSRFLPRTTGEDYYAALMAGQSYLHSLGVTSWQDAIVGAYSGMDDPASTYVTAAANGDLKSYVVGALWWERRLRRRAGRGPGRAAGRDDRRPVPRHDREDHAGRRRRERHGRDADAVPRQVRARDRQQRPLVRRGRRAARRGAGARRRGLPGARARDRRPRRRARRWTRSRAPTRGAATTSRTCS